jgi:long-subunit fatty acid transport protein
MILAIGGGTSVYYSESYAEQTVTETAPEAVIYAYFPVGKNFLLRPGVRLNISWDQTENPQALHIKETDFRYFAELGIVYDWVVLPSLSVGVGVDRQHLKFTTEYPISISYDHITATTNLFASYFQASVGFPLVKGWLVIEPYVRYTLLQDQGGAQGLGYGIEATIEII